MSDYAQRLAQEKHTFDHNLCVHDLPDIFHYWSNKYLRPFLNTFGYDGIEPFFIQESLKTWQRHPEATLRMVSVGSGDCAIETKVAAGLAEAGVSFILLCLDISDAALARGKQFGADAGVSDRMSFMERDFNLGLPEGTFDVVIANQSLHHVSNLEQLYASIKRQLAPEGCFLVSDMIGRNGHMRWPEARELVDEVWQELPEAYRYNQQLQRQEREFMDWDCSTEGFEGIRAQEVLPLLLDYFEPRVFLAWANIIDVFIDRGFGHNFRHQTEWDLHFIDRVHALDHQALASGRIKPTHLLARFQNEAGECRCPAWMTPRQAVREFTEPAPVPAPAPPPLPMKPLPLPASVKNLLRRVPGLVPLYRLLRSRSR